MKKFFEFVLGVLVCALVGVWREGLIFLLAGLFVGLPKPPEIRWYALALGGLLSGIVISVAGNSVPMFWALTVTAAMSLALSSLPRTALLTGIGWLLLKNGIGAEIYVPLYIGVIYNAILVFTYGEIYGKIKNINTDTEGMDSFG